MPAVNLYKGPVKFVLSAPGHIAGIVNPPDAKKYCYWINADKKAPKTPDAWFNGAKQHDGSWWPDWDKWAKRHAGKKTIPARPAKASRG